jgi:acyl-CoA synthetase (AMP-forming)/AMP-acid ligase II
VIYLKDGEPLSEDGLRSFLNGKLAKFKIPERIIISGEPLPRLGTGKIDRRALKAQYAH